jgi:hypothetical protein
MHRYKVLRSGERGLTFLIRKPVRLGNVYLFACLSWLLYPLDACIGLIMSIIKLLDVDRGRIFLYVSDTDNDLYI